MNIWTALVTALAVNAFACIGLYLTQQHDLRRGRIPARGNTIPNTNQPFLHWQDFATQTWGDLIGLSLMDAACLCLVTHLQLWEHGVCAGLAIAVAVTFHQLNLRLTHKPDWGYPQPGVVSNGGRAHLLYFGVQVYVVCVCWLPSVWTNNQAPGMSMATGLLIVMGSIWYMHAFLADLVCGRFDPLPHNTCVVSGR